ncbi:MAG: Hsp70 family protein [Rubripirellula sp.]
MKRSHPAIGIDLGTTNSAVAFVDSTGRPETIRNSEGGLSTPSVIFFDRGNPVIGAEAVEAGVEEPERLAMFAKRDVGEQVFRNAICGAKLPPEVLQALILTKLKEDAELKLGELEKAVITVPAFFNEPCRKATQDAGKLAGLEVLDIINEPTAAAICYGVQQGFLSAQGAASAKERVLVYDLGGGTFDVTVMEIENRKYHTIATNGDVYLGGIDWDRRVVDFIAEAWIKEHGDDLRDDPIAEQLLLRKANQIKHALTQRESVPIAFGYQGKRIRPDMNRETFKELTEDLLERTLMTVELVLDEADVKWSDLTRLILVGGSTRMPMIHDELSRLSNLEIDRSLSPDEAVAHGAAIYAGIRLGHECESFAGVSVTNVNSHDLGVLAVDPATGDPRRQIMIKRNTSLPARKSIRFRTHEDGQRNVKVEVVEGGDDRGRNATRIGKCLVDDLPRGTPKGTFVDVLFDYSQDGRLVVSANLPTLKQVAEMTMDRAAGLSEEVLEKWTALLAAGITEETLAREAEASQDQEGADDDGQLELLEAWEEEPGEAEDTDSNASAADSDEEIFPGLNLAPKEETKTSKIKSVTPPPIRSEQTSKTEKANNVGPPEIFTAQGKPSSIENLKSDGPPSKRKLKRKVVNETAASTDQSSSVTPLPANAGGSGNKSAGKSPAESLGPKSEPGKAAPPSRKKKATSGEPQPSPQPSPHPAPSKTAKLVAAKASQDKNGASEPESKPATMSEEMPDFSALEKLSEPQGKADGAALDAFFSNQNAPASGTPAPAIHLNLSQPPKKAQPPKKKSKRGKSKGE